MQIRVEVTAESMEGLGQQLADLAWAFRTDVKPPAVAVEVTTESEQALDTSATEDVDSAELDADGQPWNEKIHSGQQTKKKSGHWTLKRGVDKELVAKIYAAHTARAALATEPLARPGPIATASPAAAAAASEAAAGAPVDPFAPVAPAADPVATCLELATDILGTAADEVQRGLISQSLNAALATQNLVGTAQLMEHSDCAPAVLEELQKLGRLHGLTC